MRVLVLGAAGMLGFALHRILTDAGWHVTGTVRSHCPPTSVWCNGLDYLTRVDVENIDSVKEAIELTKAVVVINAVGIKVAHNIEDFRHMLVVNSLFPRRLGSVTARLGVRLIHFSSDGVFNEGYAPFDETIIPNADDFYGMSKYLGEPDGNHILTLRTSLVGRALSGTGTLIDWFLSQRGQVKGYERSIFSGLPVNEIGTILAEYILPKLESVRGLFHLSSASISKADLLKLVCATWNINYVNIEPENGVVIDRSLDSERLRNLIGYTPPSWPQLITSMHEFYYNLEQREYSA